MRWYPIEHYFWEKVDKRGPDECWEWKGTKNRQGYGRLKLDKRHRTATHVSIEITTGKPFPKGMMACHKCDNPSCVNPTHLFIGTARDNAHDAIRKGRFRTEEMRKRHRNAIKTHCKHGHPFSGPNLRISKATGKRLCRTCDRALKLGGTMAKGLPMLDLPKDTTHAA